MTTSYSYDQLRARPPWIVQAVFDDEQLGGDFAYTIGLQDLGFPELHLWARPTEGEDVGLDWMLSVNDRGHLLNDYGAKLASGAIGVGSEWTEAFDGGDAIASFRVDPPEDREALEAFGIAADAQILPIRWSLAR